MDYIINPMWFYWIDVLDNLNIAFGIACMICVFSTVIPFVLCFMLDDRKEDEKQAKKILNKVYKISLVIFIISSIVTCLIPSQDTMYKMLIAHSATYENVESVYQTIEDSATKIIESLTE